MQMKRARRSLSYSIRTLHISTPLCENARDKSVQGDTDLREKLLENTHVITETICIHRRDKAFERKSILVVTGLQFCTNCDLVP